MKSIAFAILFAPLLSWAQLSSGSICSPISDSAIDAGAGVGITEIKSLKLSAMAADASFTATLSVKGLIAPADQPYEGVEVYTAKPNPGAGMIVQLQPSKQNEFDFTIVMLEFGSPEVTTAGPIPPGTYKQIVSLGVIDSNQYYKNPSPMTVKKVVFNCQTTYAY